MPPRRKRAEPEADDSAHSTTTHTTEDEVHEPATKVTRRGKAGKRGVPAADAPSTEVEEPVPMEVVEAAVEEVSESQCLCLMNVPC